MPLNLTAKVFKYKIVEFLPLVDLKNYKTHSRLQVFFHKGCVCVECGLEGTQLAVGIDNGGGRHVDLYTDDLYPLTVDHIIPKSKGGPMTLENLQPMCVGCNVKKGNGDPKPIPKPTFPMEKISNPKSGMCGWLKYKGSKKKYREMGLIKHLIMNPITNQLSVEFESKPGSLYSLNRLYKPK